MAIRAVHSDSLHSRQYGRAGTDTKACSLRAHALQEAGDLSSVLKDIECAIKADSTYALAWFERGNFT